MPIWKQVISNWRRIPTSNFIKIPSVNLEMNAKHRRPQLRLKTFNLCERPNRTGTLRCLTWKSTNYKGRCLIISCFLIEVKSKCVPVTGQVDYLIQRHYSIVRANHFISLCIKARSIWNERECLYVSPEVPTHFKRSRWFRVTVVLKYNKNIKSEIY
jgi:hypothetical protein